MNKSNEAKTNGVYQKRQNTVLRKIADEALLVPVCGELANLQKIFVLNEVGEHIWNSLDGKRTVGEICSSVVEHFDVEEAEALVDVQEFILELSGANLIVEVY